MLLQLVAEVFDPGHEPLYRSLISDARSYSTRLCDLAFQITGIVVLIHFLHLSETAAVGFLFIVGELVPAGIDPIAAVPRRVRNPTGYPERVGHKGTNAKPTF